MLRASIAAIIIATTGCASMNEELLETNLPEPPEAWTGSSQEAISSEAPTEDWLATFGDNALYGLIDEAMAHNNQLLSASRNLEASRSGARIARAGLLPTLNARPQTSRNAIVTDPSIAAQSGGGDSSLGGLRANELEDQFGVDADNDGNLDGLDLDGDGIAEAPLPNRRIYINNFALTAQLSWELDIWGRISDQTRAAYKEANATLADFYGAQMSVAGAVSRGWFVLIEARQQRELAERDVTARERNLRVTERRYERGVASSLDVRLSRSALGSSKATLALRQQQEAEASRRLEVLVGRYPAAEVEAAASLPELTALPAAGAPLDILSRRPDLIAAEARMEAAGLEARAAKKAMLPSITISSSISTSGPDLADVIDPERLAGNIAAGLFQPLFQGGRLKNTASQARARAEASLLTYAQTVLEAYEEAENALAAETYLAAQEEALKLAFEEAAAAEELTERRYAQGAATIFNLLDAQTRRISSESSYIQAQQTRVSNRVNLYLAIGGDFVTEAKSISTAAVGG